MVPARAGGYHGKRATDWPGKPRRWCKWDGRHAGRALHSLGLYVLAGDYADVVVDGVGKVVPDQKSWGAGYKVRRIQDGGYCGLAGPVT
jgi:hypothetical protein